ncbi:dicarboxylate/amino acid:cation symporter [Parahaliea mediterranea]|uniref:Dicarboxylate/amino acid:cation symporter n=2 Tax=Parahaliea mediterranea TaxID=651086 RepID=A0A939ILD5_9GAMM|nr:dicarboxylate/amino acid:cation symporter [Parahaliea mediterranea]
MAAGIAVGMLLGPSAGLMDRGNAATIGNWLALPGHLFLTLIQMIVIPLVFASVIRGIAASENVEQLRKMGLRVVLFFLATTTIAIVIGLAMADFIEPGRLIDPERVQATLGGTVPQVANAAATPELRELPAMLVNLLPSNPLNSMVEGQMLQIVLFAAVVGVALIMMAPSQARPLLELMASLQEVCMTVVRWAMWLAPFAVFGLLAQLTTKVGLHALTGMLAYVFTVVAGLALLLALYLALLYIMAGKRPLPFLRAARDVLLLAFSTSSSAAVMPLSIKTAEEGLGIRPSIAQFVIPLGATINMNGTALYQGVAAIFLAQVFQVDVGPGGMALIVVTAVGASIGSPATPGVGIVILSMVLETAGIPAAGIALIMGVDRILDMCRTAVNVAGDLVACILMDSWLGGVQEVTAQ